MNYLNDAVGLTDGPQLKFMSGIFFAPSSSQHLVPKLKKVIQADGDHIAFAKYTSISVYGTIANGNMSPLGFAILFSSEDIENWTKFWTWILSSHPFINNQKISILTNQDKGLVTAIANTLEKAAQCHCSFHHCQNIQIGGGKGHIPTLH